MSLVTKKIEFIGEVWLWDGGKGSWHFVSLPVGESKNIKDNYPFGGRGFGSVPVSVTVNGFSWKTSVFPDSKSGRYILPIKKEARTKAGLEDGVKAKFEITIKF